MEFVKYVQNQRQTKLILFVFFFLNSKLPCIQSETPLWFLYQALDRDAFWGLKDVLIELLGRGRYQSRVYKGR